MTSACIPNIWNHKTQVCGCSFAICFKIIVEGNELFFFLDSLSRTPKAVLSIFIYTTAQFLQFNDVLKCTLAPSVSYR